MKTLKYILLSCVVLGAVACDDFLVETPDTSVEKSGVYNSLSSAKAALAGCYGNMAGYNGYAFNYFHVLSVTSGMGVSIKANDVNLTTMNILPSDVNMTNAYNGMYETVRSALNRKRTGLQERHILFVDLLISISYVFLAKYLL